MDYEKRLVVCVNERLGHHQKSCGVSGSDDLIKILKSMIIEKKLDAEIVEQVCLGRCDEGIAMRIAPGGPFFTQVTEHDLTQIIDELSEFKPDKPLRSI